MKWPARRRRQRAGPHGAHSGDHNLSVPEVPQLGTIGNFGYVNQLGTDGIQVNQPAVYAPGAPVIIAPGESPEKAANDVDARGKPVAESSPFDLDVHRAIELDPDSSSGLLPALPEYIIRAHDLRLDEIISTLPDRAMIILVGSSSTGKSRALWEAVQALPDDWRIWQPIRTDPPETLLKALAGEKIAPRTILWLDNLHNFIMPSASELGEKVAAGLRDLLVNAGQGPVLVLGTLWPEHFAYETGRRGGGDRLKAFLKETGRTDEAERLEEYGIEPGGVTAEPGK